MANTKLPARLLDDSVIPAAYVSGTFAVDTNTLRVDAVNNRVGIGITSPSDKLHVYDGDITIQSPSGSGGRYFSLDNTDTGGRHYGFISTSNAHGSLGGGDFALLDFDVSGNDAARTRLLIDSSGNVGIGTTSIDQLLHVEKTSGTTIVKTEVAANSVVGFEIQKTNATTSNWRIVDGQVVNGNLEIYDVTDSRLVASFGGDGSVTIAGNFKTNDIIATGSGGLSLQTDEGTKRIFVNDNGNVAIGTASLANAQLHVAADTGNSVTAVMRLRGSNSTARTTRLQFEDYSGAIADGLIDFVIPTAGSSTGAYLGLGYNSSTQLKLNNGSSQFSGNVGIGGSPTNLLQVFGGGGDSRIQFTNNATGNGYSDGFWVGIDSTQGYLLHRENTPLSFFTNGSKRMTLDTNGDLTLSDNAVVTAVDQFQNLSITSTTSANAGWSPTTNSGTFNDRGSIEVAGISNRHVFKWGFSGNLSANTWYPFAKRSELATYGPDSGGGSEDGFAMYFRIYTYTSSSGWGEYLANRLTNMVWVGNYGSNSTEEQHFIVGPALGHAPNGAQGLPKSGTSISPIQMRIHHRMGSNDHPNSDQTFEINVSSALTGLNSGVAGRQLLIYGYVL